MTHRISSLPALARAVDAVPASERHARAVAVVADALDLLVDPTGVAGDVGAVLLDERGTPGSRREAYRELAAVADSSTRPRPRLGSKATTPDTSRDSRPRESSPRSLCWSRAGRRRRRQRWLMSCTRP
ncbi:hypothetical protein [Tsukamurella soli]|uniref:hypothetical protein n=1 Tax=Tsukamurella soli TaxID=644556 RepID=UPI003616C9F5